MLARPPRVTCVNFEGRQLPLLAWPTHVVEREGSIFSGFLMPKVFPEQAVSLNDYFRQLITPRHLSDNERCLTSRLALCRSLAGIVADLHRQGHYVVDFKPENLLIFRKSCIPCFLDNDGFSIAGKGAQRFPAAAFTPEYACPELLSGSSSSAAGDEAQDRFALAVLLFQVMNYGIHPFQGVLRVATEDCETTLDSKIRGGLYAYGIDENPRVGPIPASNHECLPAATRHLFDRAFGADSPDTRPSAAQWRQHFNEYLTVSKPFAKCQRHPDSAMHIHFKEHPCAECRRMTLQVVVQANEDASFPDSTMAAPPAQSVSIERRRVPRALIGLFIVVTIALAWYFFVHH
jgi:DNA-binding helix-hairpin-helix protein with protein kinase domain